MTTAEIVEQLRDIVGWKEIIQKHRRKTDDPSITYVLKDGSRIHEDDNSVAKIAATFSRALEESGDIASRSADRLETIERKNVELREALRVLSWHYEELATMDGDVGREQLLKHDGPLKQARVAQEKENDDK